MSVAPPRGQIAPSPANPLARLAAGAARLVGDQRRFVGLALLLAALPLLWPAVPPLIDLPNHMSRYRIGLDYAAWPPFRQWFDFHWVLVGNLGVDLLATGLAPALGLEHAVKLVVLAIPLIAVGAMALIARETHGRVPATAAFAFPLAYNYPFNYGFVNFTLSAALALGAFGLWLRLGRRGRTRLRFALFVPLGFLVWLAHAAGWGMLGLMLGTWALADARLAGRSWPRALGAAVLAGAPLLPSLIPMLHWFGADPLNASATHMHFDPEEKVKLLFLALRNDNHLIDVGSILVLCALLGAAVLRRDLGFDRRLGAVAVAMLAAFVAMPAQLMGAFESDTRTAPYVLVLALLAIRPARTRAFARGVALAALTFLGARMGYQVASFLRLDRVYTRQLTALDHVPAGARVFAVAQVRCLDYWQGDRVNHLNRLAIVRRRAFTNGTWPPPGSQTLLLHPAMTAGFHDDGSQMLVPHNCFGGFDRPLPWTLAHLPRDRFEYLWLIDMPAAQWPVLPWLRPVWRTEDGALFRIARPAPGA